MPLNKKFDVKVLKEIKNTDADNFAPREAFQAIYEYFTKEYDKKGYGICLDMSPDISTNQPAIAAFTLEGAEFVTSKYPGKTTKTYARLVA